MPILASESVSQRWCDVEGTPIVLFCWVEQVMEDPEPRVLPSWLHARGRVVGRGFHSFYVCFSDNCLVSLSPRLLRVVLDGSPRAHCN
jgi:hypothetical protein